MRISKPDHYPPVQVPSFMIETGVPAEKAVGLRWSIVKSSVVNIHYNHFKIPPFFYDNGRIKICILGAPVYNQKISHEVLCAQLSEHIDRPAWLENIDSEFLIICSNTDRKDLKIISSRFVSPPFFYYHHNGCFIGSIYYNDLWLRLHDLNRLVIEPDSFYDFIAYKRIFGHKTYDKHSALIEPASVLTFDGRRVHSERYWKPDFTTKRKGRLRDSVAEFSHRIETAIVKKTSDSKRYSLFLSGGMDTRTILTHFTRVKAPPVCFTINQFENREVQVAREIAHTLGAKHVFLKFPDDHYKTVFPYALSIVGAMQLPICMFLGFQKEVQELADVAFHGHGFDYLFQGMYIPYKYFRFFGRQLPYRRLDKITAPIEMYFLKNISYRVKGVNQHGIIKKEYRRTLSEKLSADIRNIATAGKKFITSPYDLLEYLTFYNFARHYSCGDHWGIDTNAPQRTIAFDNDIYDFYQSLPLEHRFDARVIRESLKILNPRIANIISANTTYPIKASSIERTGHMIVDSLLKRWGKKKAIKDNEFQRMGLPMIYVLSRELRSLVEELRRSDRIAQLPYLDMDAVRRYIDSFLKNPEKVSPGKLNQPQLLNVLVVIDQFFKQIDNAAVNADSHILKTG